MSPKNAKNVLSNRNHKKEMPKLLNYRTGPFSGPEIEILRHFSVIFTPKPSKMKFVIISRGMKWKK